MKMSKVGFEEKEIEIVVWARHQNKFVRLPLAAQVKGGLAYHQTTCSFDYKPTYSVTVVSLGGSLETDYAKEAHAQQAVEQLLEIAAIDWATLKDMDELPTELLQVVKQILIANKHKQQGGKRSSK